MDAVKNFGKSLFLFNINSGFGEVSVTTSNVFYFETSYESAFKYCKTSSDKIVVFCSFYITVDPDSFGLCRLNMGQALNVDFVFIHLYSFLSFDSKINVIKYGVY